MDVLTGVERQRRRAKVVVGLLGATAVLAAVGVADGIIGLAEIWQLSAAGIVPKAVAVGRGSIENLQLTTFVAAAAAWLFWSHRAYANLKLIGDGQTDRRSGWVVGSWFIPVVNLFLPYQITKEVWVRSRDGNAGAAVNRSADSWILGLWWTLWLASGILWQATMHSPHSFQGAEALAGLQGLRVLSTLSDGATSCAGVLAFVVVKRIDAYQRAAAIQSHALEALS